MKLAAYIDLRRKGSLKGVAARRAKSQPLDYELALLGKFYADEGPKGMVKRLTGRSLDWVRKVAQRHGFRFGGRSGPRPNPGTNDPQAVARMDLFLRGRAA